MSGRVSTLRTCFLCDGAIDADVPSKQLICKDCADWLNREDDDFDQEAFDSKYRSCPDGGNCGCLNIRSRFEKTIFHLLRKYDWNVLKNGWPDFLADDGYGRPIFIEVKDRGDKLSNAQKVVHALFKRHGLTVLVLTRDNILSFEQKLLRRNKRRTVSTALREHPFKGDPDAAMDALDEGKAKP